MASERVWQLPRIRPPLASETLHTNTVRKVVPVSESRNVESGA